MTSKEIDALVVERAVECVDQLVRTVRTEGQLPWRIIVEEEMRKLAEQLRRKPAKK